MAVGAILGAIGSLGGAAGAANSGNRPWWQTALDPLNIFGDKYTMEDQMKDQSRLNKEAAELNYGYGEKAADNAQQRSWATWEKYQSPEAMVRQYREAGLNPALMYGGGGSGGAGGVQAGQQGSGSGNIQPGRVAEMVMAQQQARANNIQQGMAISQIALNTAQADKIKAEADGVKRENRIGGAAEVDETQARIFEADARRIAATIKANIDWEKLHWFDEDGKNYGKIMAGLDITERKVRQNMESKLGDQANANTTQINKATNELMDIQKKLMQKELDIKTYEAELAKWQNEHRNLFKTIDEIQETLGIAAGMFSYHKGKIQSTNEGETLIKHDNPARPVIRGFRK